MPAKHANGADDTPELPEILRSAHLAAILTPLIVQATARLAADFEAAQFGRAMAPSVAAIRSMVSEIRAYHRLAPLDPVSAEVIDSANGTAPAEAAEVKS